MLSIFWCFTSALIFTKIKDDKMAVIFLTMSQIPCSTAFHDDLNNYNLVPFVRGIYLFTQPLNDFLV